LFSKLFRLLCEITFGNLLSRVKYNIKDALRPVHQLYGSTPVASFGPKRLKIVRERMIADGLARGVISHRVGRIVRAFKWARSMV
jgi:hypothetical protein